MRAPTMRPAEIDQGNHIQRVQKFTFSSGRPRVARTQLIEASRNVLFGEILARLIEQLRGRTLFDQPALVEKDGVVRYSPGLLQIVRDNDHGIVAPQPGD